MTVKMLRSATATLLRGFGYFAMVLGWLWLVVIALPPLIDSGVFDTLLPDTETIEESKRPPVPAALSPVAGIAVSIVTVIMLLLTFVTLWKLPKTVTKTGDKVVMKSVQTVLPMIQHHKPMPKRRKQLLSQRLAYFIQLGLSILPVAIVYTLPPIRDVSKEVVIVVGAGLACAGVLAFTLAFVVDIRSKVISRTRSPVSRG